MEIVGATGLHGNSVITLFECERMNSDDGTGATRKTRNLAISCYFVDNDGAKLHCSL